MIECDYCGQKWPEGVRHICGPMKPGAFQESSLNLVDDNHNNQLEIIIDRLDIIIDLLRRRRI